MNIRSLFSLPSQFFCFGFLFLCLGITQRAGGQGTCATRCVDLKCVWGRLQPPLLKCVEYENWNAATCVTPKGGGKKTPGTPKVNQRYAVGCDPDCNFGDWRSAMDFYDANMSTCGDVVSQWVPVNYWYCVLDT